MRKATLPVVAALTAAPVIANAQDTGISDLGEIIVSGGFTPIEAEKFGRAVSVLTSEEIETRGLKTVQDALRAVPGVSVNGSGSSFTQVRIRGGEANHTLILIDGIDAAGGQGEYILTGLDTANIERIEVLRGPQSVFYGSNASAGVINIVTKKGSIGTEYGGSVEIGSDGQRASARVSHRSERGGLALSVSHDQDDGFDTSGDGGEEDAIRRNTVQLSGDYALTPALTLGFNLRRSDERYDYDSNSYTATTAEEYVVDDPSPYSKRDEQLAQVYAEYEMFDARIRHRLSYEHTDYDQARNGGSATETETKAAKYLLSLGLNGQPVETADRLLNVMLEWEEDSSTANAAYNRETTSVAVEFRGSFANGLDLQLGARRDFNTAFEDATTWNASGSYNFANGVRLHASAGRGIVDPSYFELFADADYGTSIYRGNTGLTPEKNRSFDIGVEIPVLSGRGTVDVTYFDETLQGEINRYIVSTDAGVSTWSYRNENGDSTRSGVELMADLSVTDRLDVNLSYTYLDAKNADGSVEVRRPRHELLLSATQQTFGGRGSVTADLRYVASNYDNQYFGSYTVEKLPNYATVGLSAQYELTDNVTLTGRVTNLFDKDYSDVWGYASRGRAAFVGLNASF
ncbi:Outer membrane cobalamin translocator [Tritonibacter multivorans]|uniref:Outer membrane cobalamin translocator n=1 Tax=Tritonibacter multivorans TaxID=928856 RepID=A0A0P1GVC9_9RHOB|nr:TonB-dependent receptor [Tritonibacter multivorans]MDA7421117.1 TonB-dependent receptor [Tritonibacter multivorans]CUH80141.1 Outer membrane cobalamin translocator [Tritonibacter multivorans]SFC74703.1 vitamin B12 transporter [Tritonibacter multivorans]